MMGMNEYLQQVLDQLDNEYLNALRDTHYKEDDYNDGYNYDEYEE